MKCHLFKSAIIYSMMIMTILLKDLQLKLNGKNKFPLRKRLKHLSINLILMILHSSRNNKSCRISILYKVTKSGFILFFKFLQIQKNRTQTININNRQKNNKIIKTKIKIKTKMKNKWIVLYQQNEYRKVTLNLYDYFF